MMSKKPIGICVAVLIAVSAGYLLLAINGYSSREGAIDDNAQGEIESPTDERPIDSLVQDWDSESSPKWPVAELMAELCRVAYQPPVDVKSTFQELGFAKWETIADGSMIGYVLIHQETAVVVFRGTDNKVCLLYTSDAADE